LSRKLDVAGKWAILAAIAILLMVSVYFPRGLLADGPFFLSSVLISKTFFVIDRSREFAIYLGQAPLVFAISVGVTSLNNLIRLHSFGLVAAPLAMWGYALYLHMKSEWFWLFVWSFSITYLTSCFSVIGEYNIAFAASALSAAILLKSEKVCVRDGAILFALAVLLTRSYESALFLNPLLIALAILAARRSEEQWIRYLLVFCCILYAVGAAVAASWIIYPRDPTNLGGAIAFEWAMSNLQFKYVAISSFVMAGLIAFRTKWIQLSLAAVFVVLSIYFLFEAHGWNGFHEYVRGRTLAAVLLFFSLGTIAIFKQLGLKSNVVANSVCAATFVILMIPFGVAFDKFQKFSRCFERGMSDLAGVVELEQSGITRCYAFSQFDSAWTNTSLSILYRRPNSDAVLKNARDWIYYNPVNPKSVRSDMLAPFLKTGPIF
jgi:hypothetical protein